MTARIELVLPLLVLKPLYQILVDHLPSNSMCDCIVNTSMWVGKDLY